MVAVQHCGIGLQQPLLYDVSGDIDRSGAHAPPRDGNDIGRSMGSSRGMVIGMATKKVTVTLPEEYLERIRRLVNDGKASSISGFVQHAVGVSLDDIAGWGAMLAEALGQTGGDLTAEERDWADHILGSPKRRKRPAA
jgi:Arc/MetJ-type ribon-helix-helix transcriptional regulator